MHRCPKAHLEDHSLTVRRASNSIAGESKGLEGAVTSTSGDINDTNTRHGRGDEPEYGGDRHAEREEPPRRNNYEPDSGYRGQNQRTGEEFPEAGQYGNEGGRDYEPRSAEAEHDQRGSAATQYEPRGEFPEGGAGRYGTGGGRDYEPRAAETENDQRGTAATQYEPHRAANSGSKLGRGIVCHVHCLIKSLC